MLLLECILVLLMFTVEVKFQTSILTAPGFCGWYLGIPLTFTQHVGGVVVTCGDAERCTAAFCGVEITARAQAGSSTSVTSRINYREHETRCQHNHVQIINYFPFVLVKLH